jgi:RimJ/RimL family protein N-acetyltransferase
MTLLISLNEDRDLRPFERHLSEIRRRKSQLWLQVHPQSLAPRIDALLHGHGSFSKDMRVNFVFDPDRYAAEKASRPTPPHLLVRPMTSEEFALPGFTVSPHRFWRSPEEFLAHGGGWCVIVEGEVASIAFTSFRLDGQWEIGVETARRFQGRKYAFHAAAALIDQILATGQEPVWSCRKSNSPSFRLAQTLGFEPGFEGAYYELPQISEVRP